MVPKEERRPGEPKWGTGGLELKLLEAWQCPASGQTQPPWDQQHRAGPGRKRRRKGGNTPRRDKTHPTIARPVQGGGQTRASVKQEGASLAPPHLTTALSSQYPTPLRGVHEAGMERQLRAIGAVWSDLPGSSVLISPHRFPTKPERRSLPPFPFVCKSPEALTPTSERGGHQVHLSFDKPDPEAGTPGDWPLHTHQEKAMLRLCSAKAANRQRLPHQPAQPLSGPPGPSQGGGHTLYLAASGQKQGCSEASSPVTPRGALGHPGHAGTLSPCVLAEAILKDHHLQLQYPQQCLTFPLTPHRHQGPLMASIHHL